jgi:hypothetical protein
VFEENHYENREENVSSENTAEPAFCVEFTEAPTEPPKKKKERRISLSAFLVSCLALVLAGGSFGIDQTTAMILSFLITAIWWAVFTVPLLRRYKQVAYVERG